MGARPPRYSPSEHAQVIALLRVHYCFSAGTMPKRAAYALGFACIRE
jgi:hypothetical protein